MLAQQGDPMELISSKSSRIDQTTGRTINYIPLYRHQGSELSADSGVFYRDELQREYFDAFGNVRITQPNGTMIFANQLNYSAETRLAILTGNVRMVDGTAILTTNYLTYNMRTGIGTYTGGGRIVNQTDTITSKNAWYFNQTKDAYFRYDVVVLNPDIKIYTDTMRYNSELKETYFYGPTNMKGNNGENLYTELGFYNTESKNASFYQKNLYTEGSRFLTGDTLHYEGQTGNGRAIGNVHYIDTADHFHIEGGIGVYNKAQASITMTQFPLTTYITESQDTTQNDIQTSPDSLASGTKTLDLKVDSLQNPKDSIDNPIQKNNIKRDSLFMTADTLFSQQIFLKDYEALVFALDREGGELLDEEEENFTEEEEGSGENLEEGLLEKQGLDSILTVNSTLSLDSTLILDSTLTLDSASLMIDRTKIIADSLLKAKENANLDSTLLAQDSTQLALQGLLTQTQKKAALTDSVLARNQHEADSLLRTKALIPQGHEVDSLLEGALLATQQKGLSDSLMRDSSQVTDTTRTRIIKAYHNVRIYKSDLQAIADSLYFGYPDSMMRMYGAPMIWAENSQLSSEEIYLQIKNSKIDNVIMLHNAFVANALSDSTRFNQIKGRRITSFFANDQIERLFVDGNAESLSFNVDEESKVVTEMYHSRSSRIKVLFADGEFSHMIPIKNVEGKIYPFQKFPEDGQQLQGFVWKPGDRPRSKADLLTRRRTQVAQSFVIDSLAQDSLGNPGIVPPKPTEPGVTPAKTIQDSTIRPPKPTTPPDSALRRMELERDSLQKTLQDTTKKVIDTLRNEGEAISQDPSPSRMSSSPEKYFIGDVRRVALKRPNYIFLGPSRKWQHNQPEMLVPIHVC